MTRVLLRKTTVNAGYTPIKCSGIDSLGYTQDKEFIKATGNTKLVPVGIVIDPISDWEGSITVYADDNNTLPLNDLNCTYDMLVLYGKCRNPADPNDYYSGIFLRDVSFNSISYSNVMPISSSELNVVGLAYDFISANGTILSTPKQLISTLTAIDTGVFYKQCPNCDMEYILFGDNKVYLSNGDNDTFNLNNNPIATRIGDNIYIAATGEYTIVNSTLTKETRFASNLAGNFTSFVPHKNKIYFTTDSGEFGYLDTVTLSETVIYTGTNFSQVIFSNGTPIAVGEGVYTDGFMRNGYRVDSAVMFNDTIIFTTDNNIMKTSDKFKIVKSIGQIPEKFIKMINTDGILYGLGESGNVYSSFGRGLNWSKPRVKNISAITHNFALGDGLYTL